MDQHEWQVDYKDGNGWVPIDEPTMRRRLASTYASVSEIVQIMRDLPHKYHANTGFATYRRNPQFN